SSAARAERNLPMEKPPEVLAERAREIVSGLGYGDARVGQASGFAFDRSFERYLNTRGYAGWEAIKTGQPVVLYFWYRQAPRYLVPESSGIILPTDPPLTVAGM